jgi:hypothetical protein
VTVCTLLGPRPRPVHVPSHWQMIWGGPCAWGGMLTPEQTMAMVEYCASLTDAAHPEISESAGSEDEGE